MLWRGSRVSFGSLILVYSMCCRWGEGLALVLLFLFTVCGVGGEQVLLLHLLPVSHQDGRKPLLQGDFVVVIVLKLDCG